MTTVAAEPRVQIAQQRENLGAGPRVEIAGRLVPEQDRRIDRQRPRNRDALALAAGELVGQMIDALSEADEIAAVRRARVLRLPARPAPQMQRQGDVLGGRQRRQQVEELEDEPDLVAPHARQRVVGRAAPAAARRSTRRPSSADRGTHDVQQRRLARPRRADDRHHFAPVDVQPDTVEREYFSLALEAFDHSFQPNHVFR